MNAANLSSRLANCLDWPNRFPPERWAMYKSVLSDAGREGIRFAVGGGLAAALYSGVWRDSKDMDIYIQHADLPRMQRVLSRNGLCDYFGTKPYDRRWIYRTYFRDTIVDVMWAMANQRAHVELSWLSGPETSVDGLALRLLPPEELLWTKLYVLQFDRSDWPDALNLLYTCGPELDWDRITEFVGSDRPLLTALVSIFAWLCPGRAAALPETVWAQLGIAKPESGVPYSPERAQLLDTRCWLAPMVTQPTNGQVRRSEC